MQFINSLIIVADNILLSQFWRQFPFIVSHRVIILCCKQTAASSAAQDIKVFLIIFHYLYSVIVVNRHFKYTFRIYLNTFLAYFFYKSRTNMNDNYKVCQSILDVKSVISSENNSFDVRIESELSEPMKTEKCILGIDEAGRGPVLGMH